MGEIEKKFFFDLPLDVGQMLGFSLKKLGKHKMLVKEKKLPFQGITLENNLVKEFLVLFYRH